MSSAFGKTWWGQQWLQSLNNIDYSNRLPRGSSYARKGSVTKITIKENSIHAKVAGSRPKPYNVDIILPPFFEPELGCFIEELALRPVIISKLLNRQLDPEVLTIAENMGLKVFPKQWTDFKMQCSCPDWAVPCKHLAAVIYKISSEIDNNPFIVFNLHRVDLIQELNKRGIQISAEQNDIPLLTDLLSEKRPKKDIPTTGNIVDAYHKISFSELSDIHEPLLALLSDGPVFYTGNGDFKEKYSTVLSRIIKNARKIIQGKIDLNHIVQEKMSEINTHSQASLYINETSVSRVLTDGISTSLPAFLARIFEIPSNKTLDYQPSIAALHTACHMALHLIASGSVVPQVVCLGDQNYTIRWLPAMISNDVRKIVGQLEEILPAKIILLEIKEKQKEITSAPGIQLLSVIITELIQFLSDKTNEDLFLYLFFERYNYPFLKPGELELCGGMQMWLQKYFLSQGDFKPQIMVVEAINDEFLISVNILGKGESYEQGARLKDVLTLNKYNKDRFPILKSLAHLSDFVPGLDNYINSKGEDLILMNYATFTPFLMGMIPVIKLLDIDILLPKALRDILKPKPSIKLSAKKSKSFIRIDQLLNFDWQVAIGDTLMSKTEFEKLLQKSDGLIKYKSQYIYANKEDIQKLHKHFTTHDDLSPLQLLRTALSGEYLGAHIELTDEARALIKELSEYKEVELPKGIVATLRPYQHRGFSWMYHNARIGFGSVLADDMGLGKTLQVITTLLKYQETGLLKKKKALVVSPTGLLTNWLSEIEKFAPSLNAHIFHGAGRKIPDDFDILLTSYGIARTEANNLKKLPWHSLIIDEAQNIKNQDTAQAKAVKTIGADNFIAMSGTPVENRLSELWSIMDFCNRGFLGNAKEFHETFADPIETYNDVSVAVKLKKATSPFMMRRLKTDKSIISDLPDKIEINSYSTLEKSQAALYEKTLEEAMKEIELIDASDKKGLFVRQGLVLQMILALKQICNHPTQFLKNKVLDASLSGKMSMLFEKLDTIVANNEKVLIFSQFTEMGKLLQHFIRERYQEEPLFYHGGCSLKQRKEMVNGFQTNHADKIFILSLKAAGTGLNLTAANHVIHYDLWWNPAVEAQATDRAYRIGQKSNVMVHRFITKNTFEERINEMIQAKKALAEMTVSTGENWIGNLSNKELKGLFEMGKG